MQLITSERKSQSLHSRCLCLVAQDDDEGQDLDDLWNIDKSPQKIRHFVIAADVHSDMP